jgi:2-keto-3-deoxy-L-fuconate dehydrogenase
MTKRLAGKTCVVTAAAQGIGRAIAEAFLSEGAEVLAIDMQQDVLEEWSIPAGVHTAVLDVTDETALAALASRFPQATVLVNCVGMVKTDTVLTATSSDLELSFRVNVVTMASMIKAFLPAMQAARNGSIINISSVVSSVKSAPDRFSYGTTKAAVLGLTKSVARDFIGDNIRCNSISPGTVESPSLQSRLASQGDYAAAHATFVARQPMGRFGTPQEIAAVAVLLASDEALFMTGENVMIDGGWSL